MGSSDFWAGVMAGVFGLTGAVVVAGLIMAWWANNFFEEDRHHG